MCPQEQKLWHPYQLFPIMSLKQPLISFLPRTGTVISMRSFSLPTLIKQEGTSIEYPHAFLKRTNQWHFRYDMTNCLYASLIEAILVNCDCKPDLFHSDHLKPCRGHQIMCVQVLVRIYDKLFFILNSRNTWIVLETSLLDLTR